MTKLLVTLTGVVGVTTAALPLFNNVEQNVKTQEQFATPKQWNIENISLSRSVAPNEWLYFSIDNINLSSMGINSIDKLHEYNTIEISGLSVEYSGHVALSGDSWKAKRNIGSENWYHMFTKTVEWTTMQLESSSTIWYSNSGDLMLRLAYNASMVTYIPPSVVQGGQISFRSGSVVKFY